MEVEITSLCHGGREIKIGQVVSTHLGRGTVVGLDPFDQLDILVELYTPVAEGSKLWFEFVEVTPDPEAA